MLLTEPFLQLPKETSVQVVWFTEFESHTNQVWLYEAEVPVQSKAGQAHKREQDLQEGMGTGAAMAAPSRVVTAVTTKLSRMRGGKTKENYNDASILRDIWRHEATVEGLPLYHGKEEEKIPYRVCSDDSISAVYRLQANPQPGTPLKILLTSDVQTMPMCAANFEKVYETVGAVDAVWANGDMVNVADRAYDWFYDENAIFKVLQGTSNREINGKVYHGAPILQNAPIYASIGNHEVMGRFHNETSLDAQFNDPVPKEYDANGFNTISWEEVYNLPKNEEGHQRYYAQTIGDVRLIVLEIANIWRAPAVGKRGRYSEAPGASKEEYGFGQFIFEAITPGSRQYAFLQQELEKEEFRNAKYKVVMCHWQHHSLGGNQVPAYTDPEASVVKDPITGLDMVIYDYPMEKDHILNYVEPLLHKAGVKLFFNGHSHLWNRFCTPKGMHILETSNVGNNYGAHYDYKDRSWAAPSVFSQDDPRKELACCWDKEDYVLRGDPYGLKPQMPTLAPLPIPEGGSCPVPYLESNRYTAFSILNTDTKTVDSYYFDTAQPDSAVVHFDSFSIIE